MCLFARPISPFTFMLISFGSIPSRLLIEICFVSDYAVFPIPPNPQLHIYLIVHSASSVYSFAFSQVPVILMLSTQFILGTLGALLLFISLEALLHHGPAPCAHWRSCVGIYLATFSIGLRSGLVLAFLSFIWFFSFLMLVFFGVWCCAWEGLLARCACSTCF